MSLNILKKSLYQHLPSNVACEVFDCVVYFRENFNSSEGSISNLDSLTTEQFNVLQELGKINFILKDFYIYRSTLNNYLNHKVKIPVYHDKSLSTKSYFSDNHLRLRFPFINESNILNSSVRISATMFSSDLNSNVLNSSIKSKIAGTSLCSHPTFELIFMHFLNCNEINSISSDHSALLIKHYEDFTPTSFISECYNFTKEHYSFLFANNFKIKISGEDLFVKLNSNELLSLQIINELLDHFISLKNGFMTKNKPVFYKGDQPDWISLVNQINADYLVMNLNGSLVTKDISKGNSKI